MVAAAGDVGVIRHVAALAVAVPHDTGVASAIVLEAASAPTRVVLAWVGLDPCLLVATGASSASDLGADRGVGARRWVPDLWLCGRVCANDAQGWAEHQQAPWESGVWSADLVRSAGVRCRCLAAGQGESEGLTPAHERLT
jgi:hypothetical protein